MAACQGTRGKTHPYCHSVYRRQLDRTGAPEWRPDGLCWACFLSWPRGHGSAASGNRTDRHLGLRTLSRRADGSSICGMRELLWLDTVSAYVAVKMTPGGRRVLQVLVPTRKTPVSSKEWTRTRRARASCWEYLVATAIDTDFNTKRDGYCLKSDAEVDVARGSMQDVSRLQSAPKSGSC